MFIHDKIDEKIYTLTTMKGLVLDETNEDDFLTYCEMRDFAEEHGGLLFFVGDEYYLVLSIIGEKDFLIIPTEVTFEN